MATEKEFDEFVKENRDLIERMIALQKGAAYDFVGAERALAMDAYSQARGFAGYGRSRAEDVARGAYSALMDPEVQRHFMNMGMEFFMGMSALMQRAPMPDFVRAGIDTTGANLRDASCRTNGDCGARKAPQKVAIVSDDEPRRDIPGDVFKSCEE